jgi:hypothetical protein
MPSAFAVLRLMISSTLVACCTGMSAGLPPFRTRPVMTPTLRYKSRSLSPANDQSGGAVIPCNLSCVFSLSIRGCFQCFIRNIADQNVFFFGLVRLDVRVVHRVSSLASLMSAAKLHNLRMAQSSDNCSKNLPNTGGECHRQRPPECHSGRGTQNICAACSGPDCT